MEAFHSGQTKNAGPSTLLLKLLENHWRQLGFSHINAGRTFRYLMSKFLFAAEEEFSEEEKVALFTSWEKMIVLCERNPEYKQKHFHYLWITRGVLQSLNSEITAEDRQNFHRQISGFLSHGRGYFSAPIYFGLRRQGELLYEVWVKTRFPKVSKAKRHVGVGYSDSGTARNVATDGSPHWTEVAMKSETGEVRESSSGNTGTIWTQLVVHTSQKLGKESRTEWCKPSQDKRAKIPSQ